MTDPSKRPRHRDHLPENVIAPYISEDLLNSLINKERFYQLCDEHGIDHPATVIYDKSMGHDFSLPWGPPYIAKPADSVAYWACGDHSLAKVYICQSWEELPKEAKAYVELLEKELGHEIQFVSTGAEREKFVLKGEWL